MAAGALSTTVRPCCSSLKPPGDQGKLDPYLPGASWDIARDVRADADGNHCVLNHYGKLGGWDWSMGPISRHAFATTENMAGAEGNTGHVVSPHPFCTGTPLVVRIP